jgi:phosphotriesterase-related protein
VIGEIGTWDPMHPNEEKALRAAARAQKQSGLALSVHVHIAARKAHDVLAILDKEGIDPGRVILGHLDIALGHLDTDYADVLDYHRSLARRGCYLEYDTCGAEFFAPGSAETPPFWTPLDLTRARAIAQLFDDGYGDRLLLSHDVFTKTQLRRYGGFGYAHILHDFQHRLREVGLGDGDLQQLLRDNPQAPSPADDQRSGRHPARPQRPLRAGAPRPRHSWRQTTLPRVSSPLGGSYLSATRTPSIAYTLV